MNERIGKFLSRSGGEFYEGFLGSPNTIRFTEEELETFIKLIVRECGYHANVFESLGCPVDMDPTETKPSDYIKKHFGVEP